MHNPDPKISAILHAIADPARRKILQSLKARGANSIGAGSGLCASDIEARLTLSQPTISHHMAVLCEAGLVASTKIGQWRLYRRNEPAIRTLFKTLKREV